MSYSVQDLVTKFREEMEDTASPYLWSDTEIVDYLDQAQKEFVRRTQILKAEIKVSVGANKATVDLDSSILDVRRAQLESEAHPLGIINFNQLDNEGTTNDYGAALTGDWATRTGTPQNLVLDMIYEKGRLVPIPTAADKLLLWVTLQPDDVTAVSGNFTINDSRHQRALLLYARGMAYEKHDAETYSPNESARFMAMFDDRVLEVSGEMSRNRRSPGVVRYGGL